MANLTLKHFTLTEYHQLAQLVGDRATLRCQSPITFNNSEPEPDFTIVQNRFDDYLSSHPGATDILLLIEVADSSLSYDQEIKLPLYAEAGISHYWIFNLVENFLEVYSEPYQSLQGKCGYGIKRIVLPDQAIALPSLPNSCLNLSKILPNIRA